MAHFFGSLCRGAPKLVDVLFVFIKNHKTGGTLQKRHDYVGSRDTRKDPKFQQSQVYKHELSQTSEMLHTCPIWESTCCWLNGGWHRTGFSWLGQPIRPK